MDAEPQWNPPTVDPTERGWYEVREVGTEPERPEVRGWVKGVWWSEVADGWRGMFETRFEWRGPIGSLDDPPPKPVEGDS